VTNGETVIELRTGAVALATVGALPVVTGSGAVQGQEAVPPQGAVCVASDTGDVRVVDPLRLVRWAMDRADLGEAAIDRNDDGTTGLAEKQLALVDPAFCDGDRCTPEESRRLSETRDALIGFLGGGEAYVFSRIRRPDADAQNVGRALNPAFQDPSLPYQLGEVLSVQARYVQIACVDPVPEPGGPPSLLTRVLVPIQEGFRLTGSLDDLGKSRDDLRSIRPAEFSINDNIANDNREIYINLFAGYQFTLDRTDRTLFSLTPFAQYEHKFDDSADKVQKIGTGAKFLTTIYTGDLGTNDISVSPYYITDVSAERRLFSTRFRVSPSLDESTGIPIGWTRQIGAALIRLGTDPIMEVGEVLEAEEQDLLEPGPFWRIGGEVGLQLRGAADSLLSQFEFFVSNKYLYGLAGPLEHFNRFETNLSYVFPGVDNYRLSLQYVAGRVDDTLQYKEELKTVLGVRF
jgi:hypothetical protein